MENTNQRGGSKTYQMINPLISGSLDTRSNALDADTAAETLFKRLRKFITNKVDTHFITIKETGSGDLYHYAIEENKMSKKKDSPYVHYSLTPSNKKLEKVHEDKLNNFYETHKKEINLEKSQTGGDSKRHKRYHDDSSSSDSSSSSSEDDYGKPYPKYMKIPIFPIQTYYYNYVPYYSLFNTVFDVNKIYVPTFSYPLKPNIIIDLDIVRTS